MHTVSIALSDDHTRIRRLLNHAFSEQALRSQESIIMSYINLMISKLDKHASADNPVDIMKYLNFLIFDITGDLTFDETFGTLKTEEYDQSIANIFGMLKFGVICN
jgi:cytochrome P450